MRLSSEINISGVSNAFKIFIKTMLVNFGDSYEGSSSAQSMDSVSLPPDFADLWSSKDTRPIKQTSNRKTPF